MKLFSKINHFFNFVLPVVLLFQWTLPHLEKKVKPQPNFGELILVKCNDPEHSHPPLSERKSSNEHIKYFNSEVNNFLFFNISPKFFNISGKNKFKKFIPLSEYFPQLEQARGPPNFEV